MNEQQQAELQRLRWQCRRGMLELDFLLASFLEKRYFDLAIEQQQQFELLLKEQDPTLYAWFFSGKIPDDKEMIKLVCLIKEYL